MTDQKFSRRDFLKLAGTGAATTAVLTGCGPASRYVVREPYAKMPEYTYNGESTFYATTCQECSAGCGLIVRTVQGRAIKVEGNPNHPISQGKTCARGQATLHGVYNPDRVQFPVFQNRGNLLSDDQITWDEAIATVSDAIDQNNPDEIAFLLGETHDHLFDLVSSMATVLGASPPLRFGALSMFEGRHTLRLASKKIFGTQDLLFFDVGNADMVVSFGSNFLETWISPVAFTRQYSRFRKGRGGKRGYFVQFESRMSQTAAVADEWVPIIPGRESHAALALGRLIAEARGSLPENYSGVNAEALATQAGIDFQKLTDIAAKFAESSSPIAIPGSWALGQTSGLGNAEAILSLNILAQNIGQPGGVYFNSPPVFPDSVSTMSSLAEVRDLISKMESGKIKALFIHGINPVFDIPQPFGFDKALDNVELVISFATFPDETALRSDYIFPDHAGLESWGYNQINTGTSKATVSGSQPVIVPIYNTRATTDVLLAASKLLENDLSKAIPFEDEVEFIQSRISSLVGQPSSLISAGDIRTFFAQFQQFGGWWSNEEQISPPSPPANLISSPVGVEYQGTEEFHLIPFISPILADKGANKPWLQETPDPTTTVMWNTWVEIHPHTAEELGIHDDDIVRIVSETGEIEASVYLYPGIRPDTIAIPFGQGHTAYGRYAQGRGANPTDLLSNEVNDAGDLVFATTMVKIQKTGKHKQLARLESRIGVYGFEEEH